jgi:hypothetical protein
VSLQARIVHRLAPCRSGAIHLAIRETFIELYRRLDVDRPGDLSIGQGSELIDALKQLDQRGLLASYFDPPLTDEERKLCELEGWILGIE